ncbi:hypothetical protein RI367_005386 [Sorochytrium milnesiophthora]
MDIAPHASKLFRQSVTVLSRESFHFPDTVPGRQLRTTLEELINQLGVRSAKAQGLKAPVTTSHRLMETDQRLYCIRNDDAERDRRQSAVAGCSAAGEEEAVDAVVGIIKVGVKRLFIVDSAGQVNEMKPLCVLDFYVHEHYQRLGYGRRLFDAMLEAENVQPSALAYDRPSPKMLSFLNKHFGLWKYNPQPNNYVVFLPDQQRHGQRPTLPAAKSGNATFLPAISAALPTSHTLTTHHPPRQSRRQPGSAHPSTAYDMSVRAVVAMYPPPSSQQHDGFIHPLERYRRHSGRPCELPSIGGRDYR